MEKSLKLILLFLFTLLLSDPVEAKCSKEVEKQTVDYVIYKLDQIRKNFHKGNVQEDVETIQRALQYCQIPISKFGLGKGVFKYWIEKGHIAEYDKLLKEVKYNSLMGAINKKLLNKLNKYPKWLKEDSKLLDKLISKNNEQRKEEEKNCTNVDNRTQALGEVRNQDSIGWCYAFGAADMLGQKIGKRLSAIDVALAYNDDFINDLKLYLSWNESDIEGGFANKAIEEAQKRGFCLEEDLPSDDYSFSKLKDILVSVETLKIDYDTQSDFAQQKCHPSYFSVRQMFKNLNLDDINEVLEKSTSVTYIDMLSDRACQDRIRLNEKIEPLSLHAESDHEKVQLFDKADEIIERGELLGISYDSNVLTDITDDSQPGWHFSTLVGRRYNRASNSCEYLIRNSWGRSCEVYDQSLDCEEGNIWVSKKDLAKRTRRIDYFK